MAYGREEIEIYHAEANLLGSCLPEALPAWEANGWTAVEDGGVEGDAVVAEPEQEEVTWKFIQDDPEQGDLALDNESEK